MPITNVAQDQIEDASGNLVDSYVATFTITGHTGTFTATAPAAGDPVANMDAAIQAITSAVSGISGISV
jgi:hypothetical protein